MRLQQQGYAFRIKSTLTFLGVLLGLVWVHATHNRAGEITYEQIGELTIRITITTYTKTSSVAADRDTLTVFWGDGTRSEAGRINGEGDRLPNDIKRNFYVAEHTYPGRATYHIVTTDPNRIGNILNVNFPSSISIPFHIETSFTFLSTQFQGSNSSAILLQPPIDYACVGQRFVHNANAYDPDGDSLAYELIVPLQEVGEEVPNYRFPDQISPGANNVLSLDPLTGDLVWNAPQRPGEYNVAFKILEYRQGVLLNSIIRDMQILVEDDCENEPPTIEVAEEICVIAGERISLDVLASDPDEDQQLSLSALGGPFEVAVSPATFSNNGRYMDQPVSGVFAWQTTCDHISEQAYSVVFKAVDDTQDTSGLADLKTLRIRVVGPPPENLQVNSVPGGHRISWDKPYQCETTEADFFRGFTVWRRLSSSQFPLDTCNPGMEGRGYTRIAASLLDSEGDEYFFIDTDVVEGETYCYRVTAAFARNTAGGYAFNTVHSLPSNEDCMGIILDAPFITKVSVEETDLSNGVIEVVWTRPGLPAFDTASNPGPYQFVLTRGEGFAPASFMPIPGATFSSATFGGLVDTMFTDQTGLNTLETPYTYQVLFFANGSSTVTKESPTASSVFLTVFGGDKKSNLSWEAAVPWQNYQYKIFRENLTSGVFELIGNSTETSYVDLGLVNGVQYCYYVETEGSYGQRGIPEPLFNRSQIACDRPRDTEPPCPPNLNVTNSCDDPAPSQAGIFVNRLSWNIPAIGCDNPDDVGGYRVYYAPSLAASFELISTIDDPSVTRFEDGSDLGIAGCYSVTTLDSIGNESDTSNIVCVDNCPFYALPNVFTPNEDGANDLYKPFPYKFIERIDLKVFNRWGQLVFETADPDINWDGTNLQGNDLSQGVYHYVCNVFEAGGSVDANDGSEVLRGYIQLIR
ncbi:MAG: gliding motility-associated C-terminal domain-containing protein [Saprospiraceae bacterium]|nr:gliding motility-associated C-terminal domain-containing protein [Saprospiraceae bacterium]